MEASGCCFVRYCYNTSFFDFFVGFTRFFGISTAVVLLGVGADLSFYHNNTGAYVIAGACLVFFFETSWVILLFMQVCSPHATATWWANFMELWTWPKALIYCVSGCLLTLHPQKLWLSRVSGSMLLLLALCHLTKAGIECRGTRDDMVRPMEDDYVRCEERFEDTKVLSSSEAEDM